MASQDDPSEADREELLLERFLSTHPSGGLEALQSWAESDEELSSDQALIERVGSLLEQWGAEGKPPPEITSSPGAATFFQLGAGKAPSAPAPTVPVPGGGIAVGHRIGPFTITKFIAKGGMGQVWEAQDDQLRRAVALKLVLPERIDSTNLELFAREARAGGRLAHPNIVTTLAHGTDEGLAWIAQELIEGSQTLKDTLDGLRKQGGARKEYYSDVAEFVGKVADALHAAHEAGVVHRDVKPQNILIAPDNTPKLTDFGLARVLDDSFQSITGDFAGTWAYMSPEQVTGKRMGLDHRTDIFSLGIVLYELLALQRPFEGDTTQQIATRIITFDPPEPWKIRSQCPRELAIICGKALEKNPERRYGTMEEFAADLRRHVRGESIHAHAPGRVYRAVKWVRRNPAVSAAAAVAALALIFISVLFYINLRARQDLEVLNQDLAARTEEASRERDEADHQRNIAVSKTAEASRERDEADRHRDIAQAVNEFLNEDLLASVAPSTEGGRGRDVLMREVLDAAAAKISGRFGEHPEIAAQIHATLGSTYLSLGELGPAGVHIERSLAILEGLGESDTRRRVEAARLVANLRQAQGRAEEAIGGLTAALAEAEVVWGADDPETLELRSAIGAVLYFRGRYDEAEAHLSAALEGTRASFGAENHGSAVAAGNLAANLAAQGRYEEAEVLHLEGLEVMRRLLGEEHPDTLAAASNLATFYSSVGELTKAEQQGLEVLESRRLVLGDEHPATLLTLKLLAGVYKDMGDLDRAVAFSREAFEGRRRVLGEDHPSTLRSALGLAMILDDRGEYAESETYFEQAVDGLVQTLGPDHDDTLAAVSGLALHLKVLGKYKEAEPLLRAAVQGLRRTLGADHLRTLTAIGNLASLLLQLGLIAEAEPLFQEALEGHRRVGGEDHLGTIRSLVNLGALRKAQGRLEEAATCSRQAATASRRALGEEHPYTLQCIHNLGVILHLQGSSEEGISALAQAVEARRRTLGATHPDTLNSVSMLGALMSATGRYAEAEEFMLEGLTGQRLLLGDDHPTIWRMLNNLGHNYASRGALDQAEALAREVLELIPESHPDHAFYQGRLQAILEQRAGSERD